MCSFIVVPPVSLLTKNKKEEAERIEEMFERYDEV
jgi:hypothetical protein